ncbi:GNAT family N-acetyltransferase [Enterovirga aerilata]|uniref:GNAT family N-acetyltransferase n=1 Tax=Enterovirga aerilata TaxID=2730920 RepID=A0A849I697_9HYPH|nr:GNAT family N-acetyltransferase [Enterovirga sp. DB1703]NNM71845.1 GNAT family N-acetyltransferase [Enterovirga sp. DB1703]
MTGRLAAALVEDEAGLEALGPQWWDLWRRCPVATPFQSPAWLLPWWGAFRPGRLCAVVVRDERQLVALAPVYLEVGPLGRRLLPIGIGITDYLDVLLDPETPEAAAALVDAAADLVPDWDVWELEELMPGAAALGLPAPPRTIEESAEQSACPVLVLAGEVPVPAGKRRKFRMAENRVARRGGEVASIGPDGVPHFLDHLIRLHGARWASRGEDGVLADDPVRRFHAAALPQLVAAGLARLTTLTIESRVVGAYYGLHHGRRAYAYLGGFDPDFAFESPGTVLVGGAIEAARQEGATEFHFLRGREAYKYEWGAVDRWNRRRSFRHPARA